MIDRRFFEQSSRPSREGVSRLAPSPMARLPMPSRRRPDEDGAQNQPPPPRRATPPAGLLRRERRAILRAREEGIRDLGGLLLEMYRRDLFREDLLREHCAELLSLDARLQE